MLAGWNTQQMLGGIEPILHLAEAGALDLGRASDLVTDSMSALGLEVKDLDGYLDKVAKTAASANTDIDALMEAFIIAGGTFERFNVPLAEANAFLGVMANRGFKGSEAGTALNAIMTRLTATTGPSAKALKELGINAFDAEGNFRGMEVVMKEVESALSELSDEERAHYQTQIAGLNHGKAFSAMLSGLGNEYDDLKGEIIDSNGALKEMRDIMKDNLQGALENLSSAFEEMQIALGSALLPAIKTLVKGLQFLADKFNALPDSVKSFIAIGAALASVLLVVSGGILLLVGFIPQIIAGFAALKTVAIAVGTALGGISAPVLIVIGLIGALIAALVVAWRKSEAFREGVTIAFEAVREVVMTVIGAVVDFVMEIWGGMVEWWQENNELITRVVEDGWNRLQAIIMAVTEFILPYIQGAWEQIVMYIEIAWEVIKTVVRIATEVIKGVITAWLHVLDGDWSSAWETIKQTFQNVWNIMKSFVSNVATIILNTIKDRFEHVKKNITNKLTEAKNNLVNKFTEMVTNAKNKAKEIVSTARQKFEEVKRAIRDKLTEAVRIVGEKIGEMPGKVKEFVSDMIFAGVELIQGLIDGIKTMTRAAIEAITGVVNGVIEKAKSLLKISSPSRLFKQYGKWTGEGLADGITQSIRTVERASERMIDAMMPERKEIDISYATPSGIKSSLATAVSGTVDVKSNDSLIVNELRQIRAELANQRQMIVELDGKQVGAAVTPHVDEGLNDLGARRRAAWGGG